jgi:hypothetical protein
LLRAAGCEAGDLWKLLQLEGLEGTLGRLAREGVYVTFDEFKGRREAVRGSQRFTFAEHDFDNPLAPRHYEVLTSGTRGRPGRVPRSLACAEEMAVATGLAFHANGLLPARHAVWLGGPTDRLLMYAKLGQPIDFWFYLLGPQPPPQARLGALYLRLLSRLGGYDLPALVGRDLEGPSKVASWLATWKSPGWPVCLSTTVSSAVRVASAALEAGSSLAHVAFTVVGEPYTEARRQAIEASGARAIVQYAAVEMPVISWSCAEPRTSDDVHVFEDRYALIQRSRVVGENGPEVEALLFSSLSPWAPKVLLNVESGDSAHVERRDCGCELGALGLHTHLSEIRSFEKLTGEGMTFARSSLTSILEWALPSRYGGSSLDYQLLEEETGAGATQLVLRVSPHVGAVDEAELREWFLGELGRSGPADAAMVGTWRQVGTVTISRQPPLATAAGKILPFHLVRASTSGVG